MNGETGFTLDDLRSLKVPELKEFIGKRLERLAGKLVIHHADCVQIMVIKSFLQ